MDDRLILFSFLSLSKFSLTLSAYEIDLLLPVLAPPLTVAFPCFVFLLKFMDIFECGCSSSSPPNEVM